MTKEKFAKAIRYLHGAYPQTFKLDIKDTYALDVWYDLLKNFDDEQLTQTLKDYAAHNVYAPNSAATIIEWEKERIMKNIDSGEKFEKLIGRLRANAYDLNYVLDKYQRSGLIPEAKAIKELYSDFTLWFNDSSQLGFLKAKFVKAYAHYYMQEIEKNIGKYQTQIGVDDKLKLGEG